MNKTAVGYVRASNLPEVLCALLERLKIDAANQGYEITKIYQDPAVDKSRSGLAEMVADAQKRKFQAVFTSSLDRISHRVEDIALLLQMFEIKDVVLYANGQSFVSSFEGKVRLINLLYLTLPN